jgi:hypothetical protein
MANNSLRSCVRIACLHTCFSVLPVRQIVLVGLLCLSGLPNRIVKAQTYMSIPNESVPVAPSPIELGYVETGLGAVHLEIPLGSFPQRGSNKPLTYKWVYDSTIWTITSLAPHAWGQEAAEKDSCERFRSQPIPKFRIVTKRNLGLKPGVEVFVSVSPSDRNREKLIVISCQLGRNYATEESLVAWILDSTRAAKRYNPQREGNDRATDASVVGVYSFIRGVANGNQLLDWRPDPNKQDKRLHIDLGPPPDKSSQ